MGLFKKKDDEVVAAKNRSEWVPTMIPYESKANPGTIYQKKIYTCKACGYRNAIQTRYCPDCGKKCKD